jgi:hypothetical protein
MIVIRNEQFQHFIATDESERVAVISSAVRKACGDRVADFDDKQIAAAVKLGIQRAQVHGLSNAEDVAAFIAVMFEVAPRFDEQPEISQLLADPNLRPTDRFYLMIDRASEKAWTEAERRYEDSFWFPNAA